ncbi:hypothetical protein [Gordonia otitidis]|uniref:hypothetical protein n=1 Tax=Gordonia otitidis TaxID=249058 RepID=UPI00030AF920|nr:hypothetical protein [Gordonia otitidis]
MSVGGEADSRVFVVWWLLVSVMIAAARGWWVATPATPRWGEEQNESVEVGEVVGGGCVGAVGVDVGSVGGGGGREVGEGGGGRSWR